ncbi:MAG TPA: YfhO family protein, partial [Ktedonobacterales bacterium]|nr:YfhO family protein [Ktedonobacterales bacterium]
PYTDLMTSHWPTALLIQQAEAQGHRLPLWNPYFAGGQPLGADPLAAVFYPPTQLAAVLPLRAYYLVLITGHLMLAGLGMLLLARRAFGLPRLPALVAAVSYMATPRLISHLGAGHVTIVQTVAWMPWLALACWATVHRPRRWGALLGLCIALTLLAGHPQMAYYALLMTAGIAIWLLVRRWRAEGQRAALGSAAGLGIAAVVGVLVASIHLVPLMEFTAHSTREASVASTDSYPPPPFLLAILGFEQPSTIPWETMLYPGLAVLFLAALGIVRRWRQGLPLLLGIGLVAALAMGYASPVYRLVAHVLPDFDRFRAPARIWFVALVGFAVLAGLGSAELLHVVRRLSSPRVAAACGLLMILIVAGSLIYTDQGYARVVDVSAATAPSALAQTSARLAGSGKIYGLQHNVTQVNAVELGVRLADGWDPLLLDNYVTYMQRASGYSYSGYQLGVPAYSLDDPDHLDTTRVHLNARLLGLMNVSLVLSRTPLSDKGLVQVGEADDTRIYRNTLDAGPGYVVRPGTDGRLPTLDQIQRVAVAARADTQTPGREVFAFTAPSDGYFVVAMPYFPGWTATLDGHPVSIQPIAGVLPAIRVGPGTHQVVYAYAPRSVVLGAALSLIGLLAILVWLIVGFGRVRRERTRHLLGKARLG